MNLTFKQFLVEAKVKEGIFRIRRLSGYKGGSNFYHHADVIAPNSRTALKAAKEGRVNNWRWIDTYDTSDKDYVEYQYLYKVTKEEARKPAHPRLR